MTVRILVRTTQVLQGLNQRLVLRHTCKHFSLPYFSFLGCPLRCSRQSKEALINLCGQRGIDLADLALWAVVTVSHSRVKKQILGSFFWPSTDLPVLYKWRLWCYTIGVNQEVQLHAVFGPILLGLHHASGEHALFFFPGGPSKHHFTLYPHPQDVDTVKELW